MLTCLICIGKAVLIDFTGVFHEEEIGFAEDAVEFDKPPDMENSMTVTSLLDLLRK